jgi:hypothetical protein
VRTGVSRPHHTDPIEAGTVFSGPYSEP